MIVHPDIETRIKKYISQGMLNTIFYGGKGVGKHYLVLRMLNSINNDPFEKEKMRYWEDVGLRFYTTSTYIRFDAKECIRKKVNLAMIIEEIARTRDVCVNNNKVIYIRNFNYLSHQQECFRQLVEDTYLTCRYVFTCRNIDSVDPALNSRCFLIRVPSPSINTLKNFAYTELLTDSSSEIDELVYMCNSNLNTLKHLIMLKKKKNAKNNKKEDFPNIVQDMATLIKEELSQLTDLSELHSLAEKFHTSELCILDICKNMDNIENSICELQKYSSKTCASLYDTMLLFLYFAKNYNKNIHQSVVT